MPTVREIASHAGVSTSTVSLVLNEKTGVSDETRRLVLTAREELEQLASRQRAIVEADDLLQAPPVLISDNVPSSIVVLHPPVLQSSYVFREVLRGIQTAAQVFHLQLRLIANDASATEQHVSHIYFAEPDLRPDGVIVFGAQQHEPLLNTVFELGIPSVVLGRNAAKYDVSGIGRDEERHSYEATVYLIEQGHRAIAFIGGEMVYDYWHTRLQGYHRAFDTHRITPMEHWIQPGDAAKATGTILRHAGEVTALIYVNDTAAAAGLPVVEESGLQIPQDVSVVSFDDTDFAQNYDPPLTSISYRRFEEGQWAVKMLIDQIRHPYLRRVQTIFDADFVIRASCAPPR